MAFERRRKWTIVLCALALIGVGACAQSVRDSPRLLVLCVLVALVLLALLCASLAGLTVPVAETIVAPNGPTAIDGDNAMAAALALEARLEHAPVALFRIEHLSGPGAATPMNANARRVVAPGRASAPGDLYRLLAEQPIDRRNLIGFDTERGYERVLAAVSVLSVHGQPQRLVALMPVESELEAEALNAWRQLVQVLTHEIMNSLTPVASLSRTAHDLLGDVREALPPDVSADLATALDAISRRAASLVDFVGSYRSLSTVPQAQPERVRLAGLFERLSLLLGPAWRARGGRADFSVEPASLEVIVDPGQLEQALINLLKNAAEATAPLTAPHVTVVGRFSRGGRLRIDVADNGPGVPDELAAHIFTPFFSTKKQGRGIGLAMVRHLVHANGGTVRYAKSVTNGARFVLTF